MWKLNLKTNLIFIIMRLRYAMLFIFTLVYIFKLFQPQYSKKIVPIFLEKVERGRREVECEGLILKYSELSWEGILTPSAAVMIVIIEIIERSNKWIWFEKYCADIRLHLRSYQSSPLDVEVISERFLTPALLCHKYTAQGKENAPY